MERSVQERKEDAAGPQPARDAGDDPGGALRAGTQRVTGTFLYVIDSALRTQAPGGLLPEGFEYSSDTNDQWLTPEQLLGLGKAA